MKDTVSIIQKDEHTFTISRLMEESVNRANLEEREQSLALQIQAMEDQLDTLRTNLSTVREALKSGAGTSSKVSDLKAVGK